jgi:hypothetical protein
MSDWELKQVPLNQINFEEGVLDLMNSPAMEPYIQFHMAIGKPGADVKSCLAEIGKLPLQQRYVWRIASALKWGFGDYDSGSVAIDRDTLAPEDLAKLTKMITARPYQLCRLLATLLGVNKMEQIMSQAITDARQRG